MSKSIRSFLPTLGAALLAFALPAQGGPGGPGGGGGGGGGNNSVVTYIQTLPYETVDNNELYLLVHMREEEKLARDVYLALFQHWQLPVFQNIAQAEQSHMNLVLYALQRYQLPDPLVSDQVGVFASPEFTTLYNFAMQFGQASIPNALLIGALIEDLDILDLEYALFFTDNRDLDTVWQNLQKGSRNHMRAFYPQLVSYGVYYPGFFSPPSVIQSIVTTPVETGAVDENGNPL